MNKLILNLNHEFDITSYSRNTYIHDGVVSSTANITFTDATPYDELVALSVLPITDVVISKDGTSVYHLADQNAKITSIYESLITDDRVVLNINIQFGPAAPDSDE